MAATRPTDGGDDDADATSTRARPAAGAGRLAGVREPPATDGVATAGGTPTGAAPPARRPSETRGRAEVLAVHAGERDDRVPGPGRPATAVRIAVHARQGPTGRRSTRPGGLQAVPARRRRAGRGRTRRRWSRCGKMAKCMRENGVPDFPDPQPDGGIQIDGDKLGHRARTTRTSTAAGEVPAQVHAEPPPGRRDGRRDGRAAADEPREAGGRDRGCVTVGAAVAAAAGWSGCRTRRRAATRRRRDAAGHGAGDPADAGRHREPRRRAGVRRHDRGRRPADRHGDRAAGHRVHGHARAKPLYRVDNDPVVLLYGTLPAYRTLSPGVTGADVKQFEQNLWALGYRGFTVDTHVHRRPPPTAVRDWQDDLGLARPARCELGRIVYAPGPVRVDTRAAATGRPRCSRAPRCSTTPARPGRHGRPGRRPTSGWPEGRGRAGRRCRTARPCRGTDHRRGDRGDEAGDRAGRRTPPRSR